MVSVIVSFLLMCFFKTLLLRWLLLRWLLLNMAASDPSYSADFEQVKNLIVILMTLNKSKIILLTLNKSKKTNSKTSMGETGCLCIFCLGHCLMSPALHPGFSDL